MTRRAYHVLIDVLRDEGVTHVFGNPGSTEMPLMDALVDAPDVAYVLGLQEATAVAMADGWALASGKVGFVNLHAMGGLGNAMGALVASKASETPLVVTAGQQDTRHLSSEPWLSGDLVALASPAMKWAGEARRGADVGKMLRRAFAIARTPPCGPVFLSLPMDVLGEEANEPAPPRSAVARLGPSPDAATLAEALAAYGPDDVVVVLGDDLAPSAADALVAFAEAGGYAVWGTQLTSRVAFPAAHPCWAGVLKPDFAEMRARLAGLKALVLVGGRAFIAYPYRDVEPIPEGVKIFHVAETPEAFGREHAADLALLGEVPATLAAAAAALRAKVDATAVAARIAARATLKAAHGTATRAAILAAAETGLTSDAAVLAVFDALPDDALITNDSAATFGAVQELMATQPWALLLLARRRARLQHAGGGRRGVAARRASRVAGWRRWRDVLAAGAVERRPSARPCRVLRLQQPPLRRVAERRAPARLRQRARRPLRRHGRDRSANRFPRPRRRDGRSGRARRQPRSDRRRCGQSACAVGPKPDRNSGEVTPSTARGGRIALTSRIWLKNAFVRSCSGWSKKSCGALISTISPSSMNATRSATLRAKPISWVTTTIVMPSLASSVIASRTSLTISGSSAEVGSSNSMIFGFMHRARAMATRCCWPPDSWPGYFSACSGILTRVRYFIASSSASRFGVLRTQIGASAQFSSTVRCGKRLNDWNTMPTSRRTSSTLRKSRVSSTPSTRMTPR